MCKDPGPDPSTSKENVFYDVFVLDKTWTKKIQWDIKSILSRKGNHSEGELCGLIVEFIEQGSANCSLWAKSCCLAMFVNKVLFEHSCSYFGTTRAGSFLVTIHPADSKLPPLNPFYKEIWGLVGLISPFVEPAHFWIMTESVGPYCQTKSCIQSKQMYCKTLEKVLRGRGFLFLGGKRQAECKWNQSIGFERGPDTLNFLLFWAFYVFHLSGLSLSLLGKSPRPPPPTIFLCSVSQIKSYSITADIIWEKLPSNPIWAEQKSFQCTNPTKSATTKSTCCPPTIWQSWDQPKVPELEEPRSCGRKVHWIDIYLLLGCVFISLLVNGGST